MGKQCGNCRHWNILDARCKVVGWPVAASHCCEKWQELKSKDCDCDEDCPGKCESECTDCSCETADSYYKWMVNGGDDTACRYSPSKEDLDAICDELKERQVIKPDYRIEFYIVGKDGKLEKC